ncbi:hypothetical protein BDZ45DRAFT_221600, partial [Acephala macrosclerotiorum]
MDSLHICLAGAFSAGPPIVTLLANNTPLLGSRSVIVGINGYSNIAGIITGQLFKAEYAPSYGYPLKASMILVLLGWLLCVTRRNVDTYTHVTNAAFSQVWLRFAHPIDASHQKSPILNE